MSGKSNVIFWLERRGYQATDELVDRIFSEGEGLEPDADARQGAEPDWRRRQDQPERRQARTRAPPRLLEEFLTTESQEARGFGVHAPSPTRRTPPLCGGPPTVIAVSGRSAGTVGRCVTRSASMMRRSVKLPVDACGRCGPRGLCAVQDVARSRHIGSVHARRFFLSLSPHAGPGVSRGCDPVLHFIRARAVPRGPLRRFNLGLDTWAAAPSLWRSSADDPLNVVPTARVSRRVRC